MKSQELEMIKRIELRSKSYINQSNYEYNRFDAYNDKTIFEVKYRNSFYNEVVIEFDKFSYNYHYALVNNMNFIYAVEMNNIIYIFHIINLVKEGFNFNWHWKEMPKTTEFARNEKIQKYIGYINIKHAYCEI